MALNPVPHVLPPHIRDQVHFGLLERGLETLDSDARFAIRRLCADVYAAGFQDGRADQLMAAATDREAERINGPQPSDDMADAWDAGFTQSGRQQQRQREDPEHPITRINPYRSRNQESH